jgi:predicted transposase/invertase (TIGR01784 family)
MAGAMMKKNKKQRNPLSPRNDYFFRRLFGDERDKEILTDFLQAALDIPPEEYGEVEILNPSSNVEYAGDKSSALDVKLRTKSGKVIGIEIQRYSEQTFRTRIVHQISKLVEEQIGKGDGYEKIHAAICIVITEFTLISENEEYHNRYRYHDERTGSTFSDRATIDVFELDKLAKAAGDEPILDWLRFLDSDEVENMEAIAEKNEGVRRAVTKFKELTASESERLMAEIRAKQERLEKGRLAYAKDQGVEEGLTKGLTKGRKEGLTEGRKEGLTEGRAKRDAEIKRRLVKLGKTEAEIAEILGDIE